MPNEKGKQKMQLASDEGTSTSSKNIAPACDLLRREDLAIALACVSKVSDTSHNKDLFQSAVHYFASSLLGLAEKEQEEFKLTQTDWQKYLSHRSKENFHVFSEQPTTNKEKREVAKEGIAKKAPKKLVSGFFWEQLPFLQARVKLLLCVYTHVWQREDALLAVAKEDVLDKLGNEVWVAANAFRLKRYCQDYYELPYWEAGEKDYSKQLATTAKQAIKQRQQIFQASFIDLLKNQFQGALKVGEEMCFPTGTQSHAVYVVFVREKDGYHIRIDNLGEGANSYSSKEERTTTQTTPVEKAGLRGTEVKESKEIFYKSQPLYKLLDSDLSNAQIEIELCCFLKLIGQLKRKGAIGELYNQTFSNNLQLPKEERLNDYSPLPGQKAGEETCVFSSYRQVTGLDYSSPVP